MTIIVKNIEFGIGIPKICIPFMPTSLDTIDAEWKQIQEYEFDIIEWRMDYFEEIKNDALRKQAIQKIRKLVNTPLLSTFRTSFEGGEMEITIDEYIKINKDIIDSNCTDFIDVETFIDDEAANELICYAHKNHVYVIGSNHDFTQTPDYDEIMHRLILMKDKNVDIPKIAYMPEDKKDVLTVLEATSDFKKKYNIPMISMSMGNEGMISRVSGEIFGSCMTFGCAKNASAPGQLNANDLKTLLEIVHSSM